MTYPGTCLVKLWEAALGTSAAPSYFDPLTIKTRESDGKSSASYKLVDGGLNANTPVLMALTESLTLWPNRKIFVVSVGTGQPEIDLNQMEDNGFHPIVDLVEDSFASLFSAKESAHMITIAVLSHLDYIDCCRWNPKIDRKKTAMDDASLVKYWRQIGRDFANEKKSQFHDISSILLQCSKFNILPEARI